MRKLRGKMLWAANICKKEDVVRVLKNSLPYLFCKKEQAQICLEFVANKKCLPWGERAWYRPSEQELAWREEMYQKIRALNKKGNKSVETIRQTSIQDDDIVRTTKPLVEQNRNVSVLIQ